MSYIYGSTITKRTTWLIPTGRPATVQQVTKIKIVICQICKTGSRIIEGCACLTCQKLGLESKC